MSVHQWDAERLELAVSRQKHAWGPVWFRVQSASWLWSGSGWADRGAPVDPSRNQDGWLPELQETLPLFLFWSRYIWACPMFGRVKALVIWIHDLGCVSLPATGLSGSDSNSSEQLGTVFRTHKEWLVVVSETPLTTTFCKHIFPEPLYPPVDYANGIVQLQSHVGFTPNIKLLEHFQEVIFCSYKMIL